MESKDEIGLRIARIRHQRGLSQERLARLSKVSRSMIAKVEIGQASPSGTVIGMLAEALSVDAGYLTEGTDLFAEAHELVPTIRRALASTDLLPIGDIEPRPLDELRAVVSQLGDWRRAAKYRKIGVVLPDLVDELLIAGTDLGEPAYALLTGAYRAANTIGHKFGYGDLSLTAVERMEWAAERSGDELLVAMAHYLRASALARIGAGRQAMALLNRTIDQLESGTKPGADVASAVYSALHMKAGVIASILGDRESSEAHLAEAQVFAGPDRVVHETVVGETNVKLHAIAAAVELADDGKAIEVSKGMRLPGGYARERSAYYWVDTARAYLGQGQTDAAMDALGEALEIAPEHFPSTTIQNAVRTAAAQERRASGKLRQLANAAGVRD